MLRSQLQNYHRIIDELLDNFRYHVNEKNIGKRKFRLDPKAI